MNIKKTFTIHPVGQGLFYSGNIKADKKEFNFVYDCGSHTTDKVVDAEIDFQRKVILNSKDSNILDLLIISHFDEDHVNKIQDLLKTNIKVKKILAPFLPFEQRIVLLLYNISRNRKIDSNYINLVFDPINMLSRFLTDEGEIIFILEDSDNEFNDDDNNEPPNNDNLVFNISNTHEITDKELQTLRTAAENTSKIKAVFDSNKGLISLNTEKVIEFMFYQKKIKKLDKTFYKTVFSEFLSNNKLSRGSLIEDIYKAITRIKNSTAAKKYFDVSGFNLGIKVISDTMNKSALVLYLHQLNQNSASFDLNKISKNSIENRDLLNYYRGWMDILEIIHSAKTSANVYGNTLLTSDTSLFTKKEVHELKARYHKYWNKITFFQIPHHGSKYNSKALLHNTLPSNCICFINFGINNSNKHPHIDVLNSMSKAGLFNKYLPINEFNGLNYNCISTVQ